MKGRGKSESSKRDQEGERLSERKDFSVKIITGIQSSAESAFSELR